MGRIWQTIRSYIWWTYPRGSIHYDVMVTLILVFIFLAPRWINFNDKPTERTPHPTGVVVFPDGQTGGFIYQIDAKAITGNDDAAIREELLRVIEPIAGEVIVAGFERVKDQRGRLVAYKVRVARMY
jgi:hypothetical protein